MAARADTAISTVSGGWSTLMLPTRADGLTSSPRSSITVWAVDRLLAMSTYDVARDFANASLTEPNAALSLDPVETKPLALAAYTLGWVQV